MRRFVGAVVVGAVVFGGNLSVANAQSSYAWIGGAATMPIGDSKDQVKTGWLLDAGFGFPIAGSQSLSIQVGGLYGSNSDKVGSGSSSLLGGMANLSYATSAERAIGAYVYAGGGLLRSKREDLDGDSKFAYQAGAGISRTVGASHQLWAEVRYLASGDGPSKMTMLPITVGVTHIFGAR